MIIEEKKFKIGLNVDNYKIGKFQKVGSTSKNRKEYFIIIHRNTNLRQSAKI
jgi:hypothetical protein